MLPQLLYFLGVTGKDSLDWGTLIVYTCPDSCAPTAPSSAAHHSAYYEESVYRQMFD